MLTFKREKKTRKQKLQFQPNEHLALSVTESLIVLKEDNCTKSLDEVCSIVALITIMASNNSLEKNTGMKPMLKKTFFFCCALLVCHEGRGQSLSVSGMGEKTDFRLSNFLIDLQKHSSNLNNNAYKLIDVEVKFVRDRELADTVDQ